MIDTQKLIERLDTLYGTGNGAKTCMTILPGILTDFQKLLAESAPGIKLQEEYRRSILDLKDAWWGLGPTVDLQASGTYMVNPHPAHRRLLYSEAYRCRQHNRQLIFH